MSRVTAGFLVCIFSFPALIALISREHAISGALAVLPFTGMGVVILGMPCFLLLRRKGWLSVWHFVGFGSGIGVLLATPLALVDLSVFLLFLVYFAALGAVHAGVFWLIAVRDNPALAVRRGLSENSSDTTLTTFKQG